MVKREDLRELKNLLIWPVLLIVTPKKMMFGGEVYIPRIVRSCDAAYIKSMGCMCGLLKIRKRIVVFLFLPRALEYSQKLLTFIYNLPKIFWI